MKAKQVIPIVLLAMVAGCKVYTHEGPETDPDAEKQYVCHQGTKTMRLPDDAIRSHLNHGDRLGRCQ